MQSNTQATSANRVDSIRTAHTFASGSLEAYNLSQERRAHTSEKVSTNHVCNREAHRGSCKRVRMCSWDTTLSTDLRIVVFGSTRTTRAHERLNAHIRALKELFTQLDDLLDNPPAVRCNTDALDDYLAMDTCCPKALVCKRALLLMAMHIEPEVLAFFAHESQGNHRLCATLKHTVLPVLVPTYVGGLCQHVQMFCNAAALMCGLWDREPIKMDSFVR